MVRPLVLLGVLAGCAPPPAFLPALNAPASEASISLSPLAAVQPPALPPALRAPAVSSRDARSTGDHAMADPSTGASSTASPADTPLGEALAAYLRIHAALASDTIDGVDDAARAFEAAFGLAIRDAPADDPHLWHVRSAETGAVRTHASALAEASDLAGARDAFGRVSAPFAALIEAVGAPDGFDLVRHTCGMQPEAPEGGVWLQRAGDVRNPYFGDAMQMCARERAPVPSGIEADVSGHASRGYR